MVLRNSSQAYVQTRQIGVNFVSDWCTADTDALEGILKLSEGFHLGILGNVGINV